MPAPQNESNAAAPNTVAAEIGRQRRLAAQLPAVLRRIAGTHVQIAVHNPGMGSSMNASTAANASGTQYSSLHLRPIANGHKIKRAQIEYPSCQSPEVNILESRGRKTVGEACLIKNSMTSGAANANDWALMPGAGNRNIEPIGYAAIAP